MPLLARTLLVSFACGVMFAQTQSIEQQAGAIVSRECLQCHGQTAMSGLDLRTRESALKGGQHGAAIAPGDASSSRLFRRVSGQEKPAMPMNGRLSEAEISVLKTWIEKGAGWDLSETSSQHTFTEQQRR